MRNDYIGYMLNELTENINNDLTLLKKDRSELIEITLKKYKSSSIAYNISVMMDLETKKITARKELMNTIFNDEVIGDFNYILDVQFKEYKDDEKLFLAECIIEAKIEYEKFLISSLDKKKNKYDKKIKYRLKKLQELLNSNEAIIIVDTIMHPNEIFKHFVSSAMDLENCTKKPDKNFLLIIKTITDEAVKKLPTQLKSYTEERTTFLANSLLS